MTTAEEAVAGILGEATTGSRSLASSVWAVERSAATPVIVKRGCGEGAAPAEAAGLRWLEEAGAVTVPAVLGADDVWLVTELLEPAAPSRAAAERLGRGLAELHRAGAPAFGAPPPDGPEHAWIGLAPMRNVATASWPDFYARYRIEPYLRSARDAGTLDRPGAAVLSQVCERLGTLGVPEEGPARLHGDLWSGNVFWSNRAAALIDPAAHGGHRETDLAMLHVFGCPHLEWLLAAYQECAPLADGWADRVPLHQLYPLLVHAVLFGGGYAARAVSAARQSLALG